jgi:ABC-type multidrug transport system ATPase subunit
VKITLRNQSKCLKPFAVDDLPDLTIITGKNGAGKSALLRALSEGLEVDFGNGRGTETVERLLLTPEKVLNTQHQGGSEPRRTAAKEHLSSMKRSFEADLQALPELEREQIQRLFAEGNMRKLRDFAQASGNRRLVPYVVGSTISDDTTLVQAVNLKNKPCVLLDEQDIDELYIWGKTTFFGDGFTTPFKNYQRIELENDVNEIRAKRDQACNYLPRDLFLERFGSPPWELANRAIAAAGLPYRYREPAVSLHLEEPRLETADGTLLTFEDLSSGERVLLNLAQCIFNGREHKGVVIKPDLLLLDEVDAFLHPEMTRRYINLVDEFFVRNQKMRVIMVTHSPSTVALAPPESIYLLERGRELRKVSKASALNVLTEGVPTLAIDFDGRRQVFTESAADAKTYDALYRVIRQLLPSGRSLEFIDTGSRSGCAEVKSLVNQLSGAGNASVFGLIDSDGGKNKGTSRIHVLGDGSFDGLESVVLNPLLIAGFICHSFQQYRNHIGLKDENTFLWLCSASPDVLQGIVSKIAESVFQSEPSATVSVRYLGGFCLDIDERCLKTDDHEYENLVLKSFDNFESVARKKGGAAGLLMQRIVGTVVAEQPNFLPMDAFDTLKNLLMADAHVG